jgi:hypothetical protein
MGDLPKAHMHRASRQVPQQDHLVPVVTEAIVPQFSAWFSVSLVFSTADVLDKLQSQHVQLYWQPCRAAITGADMQLSVHGNAD